MSDELAAFIAAGHAAWPQFAADAAVTTRIRELGVVPMIAYAADFYLACACASGDEEAIAVLDRMLAGEVATAIRRVDRAPSFIAEVAQIVRERLFVGPTPKIREYAGRAALKTWIATVAVRTALNARRGAAHAPHAELDSQTAPVAIPTPELAILRSRHKVAFEEAVRAALALLTVRERTLLRLHLVEHMTIDQLGLFYGIGRSTAARWLANARTALADHTREVFCASARMTAAEFASVAGALRSDLDVSLASHLRDIDDLELHP